MEHIKIVDFDKYCPTCKYFKTPEENDPCNECLSIPARDYSHKPEHYCEKDRTNGKQTYEKLRDSEGKIVTDHEHRAIYTGGDKHG